jgi:hypothetical protein
MEDYKQHYQLSKDKKCGLMRIRPILEKQLLLDKVRVCFEKNSHIFTRQELDKIYGASGQYRRIRLLVFILQQKSILQLQAMQDLLEKNGLQGLSDLLRRLDDSKHNFFGVVADQSMSPDNRGHLYRLRPQLEKSLYLESYISQLHQHAEHGFLTDDEESRIMKHNTPLAQACQFMQILVKKGNKSYHGFMDVLKQNHITLPGTDVMTSKPARKLSRGRKSSSSIAVPLTDARKKALGSFECFTLEVLCFISSLHEAAGGFLSYDEEEDVVQQPSEPERVRKLIDIMKRRDSSVVYEHFIHVLKQSGMASDANILLDWERINNAPGSSMHNLPEAHDLIDQYIDLKCDFVAVLKESDRALWPRVKDYVVDRLMATSSTSSKNSSVLDSFADAEIENGSRILFFTLNNWFGFKLLLLIFNRFHSEFRMVVYKLDQYKEKLKPLMDSKLSQVEQIRCVYEEEASTPEGCERVIMRLGLDHKEMTVSGLLEAKDFIARELHLCTTALDEFKWAQSSILFCFTITSTLASPIEERLQDPTVQHNLSEELSIDLILVGQKGMVIRVSNTAHSIRNRWLMQIDCLRLCGLIKSVACSHAKCPENANLNLVKIF